MDFATKTIHAGQPSEPHTGAIVAPIFQTTTYQQEGPGEHRGYDYTRTNNPTRQRLEGVLAALEGGTEAAVFGSGLAAEHAVLQAYLKPGDEIIVPGDVYGGTFRMLHKVFEPIGCVIKQVDFAEPDEISAALSPATRLVWLESPTNPRLLVYDIAEISRRAHAGGALVVVDNTFATPFFQRPFDLGADLIVHSVTKYLAGHSDLVQGAVIGRGSGGLRAGEVPPERARRNSQSVRLLADAARIEDAGAADAAARRERDRRGGRALPSPAREEGLLPGSAVASRARHCARADVRVRRHGVVRARRHGRGGVGVRLVAGVFRAWREPGRRACARVFALQDDARVDSCGDAARARPVGHAGAVVTGMRERQGSGAGSGLRAR